MSTYAWCCDHLCTSAWCRNLQNVTTFFYALLLPASYSRPFKVKHGSYLFGQFDSWIEIRIYRLMSPWMKIAFWLWHLIRVWHDGKVSEVWRDSYLSLGVIFQRHLGIFLTIRNWTIFQNALPMKFTFRIYFTIFMAKSPTSLTWPHQPRKYGLTYFNGTLIKVDPRPILGPMQTW